MQKIWGQCKSQVELSKAIDLYLEPRCGSSRERALFYPHIGFANVGLRGIRNSFAVDASIHIIIFNNRFFTLIHNYCTNWLTFYR